MSWREWEIVREYGPESGSLFEIYVKCKRSPKGVFTQVGWNVTELSVIKDSSVQVLLVPPPLH